MSHHMRITAHMNEPVGYYGDGMHFDGILAYAAYASMSRPKQDALPAMTTKQAHDFDLPLDRWSFAYTGDADEQLLDVDGNVWGWMASAVQAEWSVEAMHEIRKKPAAGEMSDFTDSRSVVIGSGPLKAYNMTTPTRFAHELQWYAVGDANEVRRLLENVHAIGKKANIGLGVVRRWVVEDCGEVNIYSRRRMPLGWPSKGYVVHGAIRAPYHHRSRRIDCREPSVEAG